MAAVPRRATLDLARHVAFGTAARVAATRYLALALNPIGDVCRATRLDSAGLLALRA